MREHCVLIRRRILRRAEGNWRTVAAWLRTRKTNWEKQKKPSRELLGPLRRKLPQWVKPQARLRRNWAAVHRMCISKAARPRLTVGRNIQRGYQSSAAQVENAMEEYPLAVGIGFAALGCPNWCASSTHPPGGRVTGRAVGSTRARQRKKKAKNCSNAEKQSRNASLKARWKKPGSRASRQKRSVRRYPNSPEKSAR